MNLRSTHKIILHIDIEASITINFKPVKKKLDLLSLMLNIQTMVVWNRYVEFNFEEQYAKL